MPYCKVIDQVVYNFKKEVNAIKREEKNLLTRQRIIDSAIVEFGNNSYAESSLNTICKNGNLSKGIIYHYFKDKDELYLVCVTACFEHLILFLKEQNMTFSTFEAYISNVLDTRHRFFSEYPHFSTIFASAVLQPPKHLIPQIQKIKSELDRLNVKQYKQALENVQLKNNISVEEAVEFFLIFQESFNHYYHNQIYNDYRQLIYDHELKLNKMLKMMIYGIVEESEN